ncbi:MAG: 23S rRNA (pseudouridine(1915)-N(3))-methyltransferase RlmH, partial [Lachnospiraceae bacterium]|nr:23S rRNA (pseudouridine(1915)-N(3))-methyltransferase RlmH [Lachnospiraceae bacterium]
MHLLRWSVYQIDPDSEGVPRPSSRTRKAGSRGDSRSTCKYLHIHTSTCKKGRPAWGRAPAEGYRRIMIRLLCIGKMKDRSLQALAAEYVKRISPFAKIEIIEVKDEP